MESKTSGEFRSDSRSRDTSCRTLKNSVDRLVSKVPLDTGLIPYLSVSSCGVDSIPPLLKRLVSFSFSFSYILAFSIASPAISPSADANSISSSGNDLGDEV